MATSTALTRTTTTDAELRAEILATKGSRSHDFLHLKSKRTGKHETIERYMIKVTSDPNIFSFFILSELDAYKAAYQFRDNRACKIEHLPIVDMWRLTVVNK